MIIHSTLRYLASEIVGARPNRDVHALPGNPRLTFVEFVPEDKHQASFCKRSAYDQQRRLSKLVVLTHGESRCKAAARVGAGLAAIRWLRQKDDLEECEGKM